MELIALFAIAAATSVFAIIREHMKHQNSRRDPRSVELLEASAASDLVPKFNPLVTEGSEIFLPVGAADYPGLCPLKFRQRWLDTLEEWLGRGATINIIVSIPSPQVPDWLLRLKKKFDGRFHVYFLHRDRAKSKQVREQIKRLDTFHPVILYRGPRNGSMWIEHIHRPGSVVAYNVEFVAPEEIPKDPRFKSYLAILRRLINEKQRSAHLEILSMAKMGQRKQARVEISKEERLAKAA